MQHNSTVVTALVSVSACSMARGSCGHALVSESACSTTPWLVAVVDML